MKPEQKNAQAKAERPTAAESSVSIDWTVVADSRATEKTNFFAGTALKAAPREVKAFFEGPGKDTHIALLVKIAKVCAEKEILDRLPIYFNLLDAGNTSAYGQALAKRFARMATTSRGPSAPVDDDDPLAK